MFWLIVIIALGRGALWVAITHPDIATLVDPLFRKR
jgi:hypothetical protein